MIAPSAPSSAVRSRGVDSGAVTSMYSRPPAVTITVGSSMTSVSSRLPIGNTGRPPDVEPERTHRRNHVLRVVKPK